MALLASSVFTLPPNQATTMESAEARVPTNDAVDEGSTTPQKVYGMKSMSSTSDAHPSPTRMINRLLNDLRSGCGGQPEARMPGELPNVSDEATSSNDKATAETVRLHLNPFATRTVTLAACLSESPKVSPLTGPRRRSLGVVLGLHDAQARCQKSVDDSGSSMNASGSSSTEAVDEDQWNVSCKSPPADDESLSIPGIDMAKSEREIIVVEMREKEEARTSFDTFYSDGYDIEYNEDLEKSLEPRETHELGLDEQYYNGCHLYDVTQEFSYNYLEPVAEVTEEPTFIRCTLEQSKAEDDRHWRKHSRLSQLHSTPTKPSKMTLQNDRTPVVHKCGWAEVIASQDRKSQEKARKDWVYTSLLSPSVRSPGRLIGLNSNFWLSSPPRFVLQGIATAIRQPINPKQKEPLSTSKRLLVDARSDSFALSLVSKKSSGLSEDDSDWVNVDRCLRTASEELPDQQWKVKTPLKSTRWVKRLSKTTLARRLFDSERPPSSLESACRHRTPVSVTPSQKKRRSNVATTMNQLASLISRRASTQIVDSVPSTPVKRPGRESEKQQRPDLTLDSHAHKEMCGLSSKPKSLSKPLPRTPSLESNHRYSHASFLLASTPIARRTSSLEIRTIKSLGNTAHRIDRVCSSPIVSVKQNPTRGRMSSVVREKVQRIELLQLSTTSSSECDIPPTSEKRQRCTKRILIPDNSGAFVLVDSKGVKTDRRTNRMAGK